MSAETMSREERQAILQEIRILPVETGQAISRFLGKSAAILLATVVWAGGTAKIADLTSEMVSGQDVSRVDTMLFDPIANRLPFINSTTENTDEDWPVEPETTPTPTWTPSEPINDKPLNEE